MPFSHSTVTDNSLLPFASNSATRVPSNSETSGLIDITSIFEDGIRLGNQAYSTLTVGEDGWITFGGSSRTQLRLFTYNQDLSIVPPNVDDQGLWIDFNSARDSVVITWNNVVEIQSGFTARNTYQIELMDRGDGDTEVIMRYHDMNGAPNRWRGSDRIQLEYITFDVITENIGAVALETTTGNTSVAGVWQYRFEDGWLIGGDIFGGFDTLTGTTGADTLTGRLARNAIRGLDGDDTLTGNNSNDTMTGDAGNDLIDAQAGHDHITGGAGNDTLLGGNGSDTIGGGDGDDSIDGGDDWHADTLHGGEGNNTITGGSGNDYLTAGSGNDSLDGGADSDTLNAGAGDDVIHTGQGNDIAHGGDGNDTITSAEHGHSLLTGGNGDDSISGSDHYYSNDTLLGSGGNDTLDGGAGRNVLQGGSGNDVLLASTEDGPSWQYYYNNNQMNGGTGDDTITGANGNDTLGGQAGNDVIAGGAGHDRIGGGGGDDTIEGSAWNVTGNDWIYGGDGADSLRGGGGNDTLFGGDGDDMILGGYGNDILRGGDGDDFIFGGAGYDDVSGGAGADRFFASTEANDVTIINDYNAAEGDWLVLDGTEFSRDNLRLFGDRMYDLDGNLAEYRSLTLVHLDEAGGLAQTLFSFTNASELDQLIIRLPLPEGQSGETIYLDLF